MFTSNKCREHIGKIKLNQGEMAGVKLITKGVKNPSQLYIRYHNGREFDVTVGTNSFVNPKYWDNKKSEYKNVKFVNNRVKLNITYGKLKTHVLEKINEAYILGEIIDKDYLRSIINSFFNRPVQQKSKKVVPKHLIYFYDFCVWWLENESPTWKTAKNKYLDKRAIQQYYSFLKIYKSLDPKKKFKVWDIDNKTLNDFIFKTIDVEGYSVATVKRHVRRFKFFLARAESKEIKVSKSYKDRVYVGESDNVLKPYLNHSEIEQIYNKDLSHDSNLDSIRDSFIIGLWTGLRISDFNKKLNLDNISDGFISLETTKTGAFVTIPIHPHVKAILKKRFGNLPPKTTDPIFNKKIKDICMICDIDEKMKGHVYDGETKRNKLDIYKKYQLVTSHICRRSFATNLLGKVPNKVIMSAGGWKTESMMLHYVKRTKIEDAKIIKGIWENTFN